MIIERTPRLRYGALADAYGGNWVMIRPVDVDGPWLIIGEQYDDHTWRVLRRELDAEEDWHQLAVVLHRMTRAEVDACDVFGGW